MLNGLRFAEAVLISVEENGLLSGDGGSCGGDGGGGGSLGQVEDVVGEDSEEESCERGGG